MSRWGRKPFSVMSKTYSTSVVFEADSPEQAKAIKDGLNHIIAALGSDGIPVMSRLIPEMQGMLNDFGEQGVRELYQFSKNPASKLFLKKFRK